jgi:hypothetical protein
VADVAPMQVAADLFGGEAGKGSVPTKLKATEVDRHEHPRYI